MLKRVIIVVAMSAVVAVSCSDDEPPPSESSSTGAGLTNNTGQACDVPEDCYPLVADTTQIAGDIMCLDRVPGGYCTHTCTSDDDCCSVEGECAGDDGEDISHVCGPFESTGLMLCFVSCEKDVIGNVEENEHCRNIAGPSFICRSTGGGANNRKVCVPHDDACGLASHCGGALPNCCTHPDGAQLCTDDEMATDLTCL